MVVAMAGGGLVFRLLQVQMSCDRACRVSMRSLMKSHWNVSGFRGVLAAWRGEGGRSQWDSLTVTSRRVVLSWFASYSNMSKGEFLHTALLQLTVREAMPFW